jgi:retinol dehydrogenase-12
MTAWGRIGTLPEDITKGLKSKSKGGSGGAKTFIEYCDNETKKYV